MAIRPSAKYPGQTLTASAGYPYGSARNVNVVGDGTGTPLEADWVNDLWGFLQAVLAGGGVIPSGSPDTATTSQYLTALKTVMLAHAAANLSSNPTFLGMTPEWVGVHEFTVGLVAGSLTVGNSGVANFQGGVQIAHATNELVYFAPRTRTKIISVAAGVSTDAGTRWVFNNVTGAMRTAYPLETWCVPIDLPDGCTLIRVRAGVTQGAIHTSDPLTMEVYSVEMDATVPISITPTLLGSDACTASGDDVLSTAAMAVVAVRSTRDYQVWIHASDSASGGDQDVLHWLEVQYSETRGTGSH